MSQTLAVAARELRERWLLFPAGLLVGMAPFLMTSFGLRPEQTPVVGLLLAVLLGAIAAFVAGGGMLARDAADGRLAFLFARPVPWPAIWGGKWLAAVVLVFGSAFLALLPVILAYPPPSPAGGWRAVLLGPDGSALFLVLLFLGIGLSNFNATVFRSRSAWLALDLGFLLLAIRLVVLWVGPLYALLVFRPWATGWWISLLGVPALALLLASVAQVGIGRTDLRRAHQALSVSFWAIIFVFLVAAGLRLFWARGATPADLTGYYAGGSADPSGRWLYVSGESSRGGAATFLVDADRDRYVPLGVRHPWEWGLSPVMAFAAEGGSGVILEQRPEHAAFLHVDFREGEPRFAEVELESSPPPGSRTTFDLSASGATAVLAHQGGASLFEIPSGRRVATTTFAPGWSAAAVRFLEEHRVRLWLLPQIGPPYGSNPPAEMRIVELAVGEEPRTTATPLEAVVDHVRSGPRLVYPDRTGQRILTFDGGVRLRDGATGALIATLQEGSTPTRQVFLADGRVVMGAAAGARTSLQVFSSEGAPGGELLLDRVASGLGVGPEVAPGKVAVRLGRESESVETLVVDVDERRVLETLPGLHGFWTAWLLSNPMATPDRTRYFFVQGGAIVRRDFATGEVRVVAGEGASPGERLVVRW